MPELSNYEQQRLENIKRNEALMRELDLLNGASALGIDPATTRQARAAASASSSSKAAAAKKPKITAAEAKARKEAAEKRKREREAAQPTRVQPPRRSSARLAGVEADSEVLKRKYEEQAEAARQERELAKRARHEDHDLSRLTGGGLSEAEVIALRSAFTGLVALAADGDADETMKGTPRSRTRAAGKQPQSSSIEMTELKAELDKMGLQAVSKVTQRRIYSLAFHPTIDKDLIFAGDKEGAIGVWEPWAAEEEAGAAPDEEEGSDMAYGKAWSLQAHGKDPITCLKFDPVDAQSLYSCSYDCTIRHLSLASDVLHSTEIWAGTPDVLLSIFDVLAPHTHPDAFTETPMPGVEERSIWIADHRGGLIHVDVRERPRGGNSHADTSGTTRAGRGAKAGHQGSSSGATSRRWQVAEKKIGALSVNSRYPYAIATAGLDQHVRLFDVRALESMPLTMEPPYNSTAVDGERLELVQNGAQRASSRARLACTSVDWSPRGDQLAALSYDDIVKIWDVEGSDLTSGFSSSASTRTVDAVEQSTSASSPAGQRRSRRSGTAESPSAVKKEKSEEQTIFRYFKQEPKEEEVGSASPRSTSRRSQRASNADHDSKSGDTTSPLLAKLGGVNILETPVKTVPHNNQTGKWLTMFRAKWNGNAAVEPHFSLGSMHRHAEIWSGKGELLRSLYDEEWVTAVPAVTAMHPRRVGRLVTGNASGKCYLWCPPPSA
ncbi:hypothetical protein V8E36_006543 [Tilletia maclaganii]